MHLSTFSSKWTENKALLLEAEYFASKCNRNLAKEKYEASIQSAQDQGALHEKGLALEVSSHISFSFVSSIPTLSVSIHRISCLP